MKPAKIVLENHLNQNVLRSVLRETKNILRTITWQKKELKKNPSKKYYKPNKVEIDLKRREKNTRLKLKNMLETCHIILILRVYPLVSRKSIQKLHSSLEMKIVQWNIC